MASTSSNNSIIQSRSSSSTSSSLLKSPKRNFYDVFVSFRGQDTRYNLTDHLFAAFQRKGIFAFRNDTKMNKGESIGPELLQAIKVSQIFIVVFSKNYASSTCCLQELECILQCSQLTRNHVLPIFYNVDPSEVRCQKGIYGEALAEHEERFQQNPEIVQRWREALTQVANLSGWDLCDKPQYVEIRKIVKEIINILGHNFSSLPKDLVGMHSPIAELEKHLHLDLVDVVQVVGISGMGGIGKTTLAIASLNKISHQFDVYCFIDDLSKLYRHGGPISAQKKILHQLGEEQIQTCNLYDTSNLIRSRLHCVKALIILDTVDQIEQLETLGVSREWLSAGSRIIIISRDENILKEYGVDVVYKVPLLNQTNSLQLFSRKAFKLDHILSNYEELAVDILSYADGLPLAIKVFGSFLYGRDIAEWESALAKLREIPNNDIMDVLKLSFDGLNEMEKELFLHIACFFNRHKENYVKNVLSCCGFHVDTGFRVLTDKSLLSISESNRIELHRLFEKLGRQIVQENQSKESRKWSRVWLQKQLYNAVMEKMEHKVEAIFFLGDQREKNISMVADTLSKMSHLRLLILKGVNFSGNLSYLSNKLRYVEWDRYPLKYLPSSFEPNQLVELILRHSSLKKLWKEKKYLPNLRTLDLSHSKNLRNMPNFGELPNLERLSFEGCVKLVQIDPSIGVLRKLVFLNLKDCKNLVSIPNNICLISLECLNLSGCPKLFKNPRHLIRSKNAPHSQSTTSSILKWTNFRFHSLCPSAHTDLASCLLGSMLRLSCLHKLDISFCGLSQLPDAIGCLHWLERLDLRGNNFVTLPSMWELSKLVYLNLEHCKMLESLPQLPFPMAIKHDLRINNIDITNLWRRVGLVIFNCPKLGETECCSSIAFSWMKQLIQARHQSSTASFHEIIDIVIPGSEVPIWFNYKSEGDSIRMDLSPIMHDDNDIIGICCCAVFSVAPVDPTLTTHAQRPEIDLYISNSKTRHNWYVIIPVNLERHLIEVKSDHMCLFYFPLESFFYIMKWIDVTLSNLEHFNMKVRINNGQGLDLEVQNCGYHWVYKQNHAKLQKFLTSEVQVLAIDQDEAQPSSKKDEAQPRFCTPLHKTSLIILDNVDRVEQLEKLAMIREWLGLRSRIIIISRDEHILKEYGVDVVYKIPLLNWTNSLQLFSKKAFKLDHIISGYDKLAIGILCYANGLPLAIKVLGSFLFDRDIDEWESALARLKESPNKDIMDVLQLSFDGLEELEKEIFLHIACFYNRFEEKYVKNILNCCGFQADIGLRVLIDKSLIILTRNAIEMHGLFVELGKKIVQEKSSKESRKWSRVWLCGQFNNVSLENMEKKVEAVRLVTYRSNTEMLMAETLSKMNHLRMLILRGVIFSGNLSCLSNELRYVDWDGYPYKYLPSSFQPNQLVELILSHSNVIQLWKDKKCLPSLRTLDLSDSKNLRKMPHFGEIPNLERLSFEGCVKLVQIDPSIGALRKLVFLNLNDCEKLVSIPNNIFDLSSLECVNLSGCPKVFENPKHLNTSEKASHSQSTTSSILKWTKFRFHYLYPDAHKYLASCLLPSLLSLSSLRELDISFCGLRQLPDAIGCLRWLEGLYLGGNNFVTIPSLRELSRLARLDLEHCKLLESLPLLPFPTAIKQGQHMLRNERSAALIIFNSPKLDERERCSSIALSWMTQLIQANQESCSSFDWMYTIFPESEIPIWCNNQSQGDSIRIDPYPIMHGNDNNFIGIACCIVFSVKPVHPITPTYAKGFTSIGIIFSNRVTDSLWYRSIPVIIESDLIEVKSDHMCLIYFPLEPFFDVLNCIDETSSHLDDYDMKAQVFNDKGHLEVLYCGYRWVYEDEAQPQSLVK